MTLPVSTAAEARPHTGLCCATGCPNRWATIIPANEVRVDLKEAVCGYSPGEVEILPLCWKHYKSLRRVDGYTLGWRTIRGKLTPYVKQEHY